MDEIPFENYRWVFFRSLSLSSSLENHHHPVANASLFFFLQSPGLNPASLTPRLIPHPYVLTTLLVTGQLTFETSL